MIEFLTVWVKSIVFVVLFATFLEFLLPNSSMQRFVKVIVGIFIMLTVLNPIVDFIHTGWSNNSIIATASKTADYSAILNAKQKLAQDRDFLAQELYKTDIAKQAQALVAAIDGVANAKIVVKLAENNEKGAVKIKELEVYIQPGLTKKNEKVNKVTIGISPNTYQDIPPELSGRIKKTLCEFYQLKQEQVSVKLLNEN